MNQINILKKLALFKTLSKHLLLLILFFSALKYEAGAKTTIFQQACTLTTSITSTSVSCFGGNNGSAQVSASGGTSPYSYSWNNGNTTSSNTGLTAGVGGTNYSVTITDNLGCTSTASVNLFSPTPIGITFTTSSVTCRGGNNGTATAIPSGGVSPYTYKWSANAGGLTNAGVTGLTAGNYEVSVHDNNNCSTIASIAISQPTVTIQLEELNVTCNQSNGSATVLSVSGLIAPYTYLWSTNPVQTGSEATGLSGGYYSVTVTGNNGCQQTTQAEILPFNYTITQAAVQTVNISCNKGSNGEAIVGVSGGTSPYAYQWESSNLLYYNTNQEATGMSVGTYTVTITDNDNCILTATVTITQPSQVTATLSVISNVSCFGGSNGNIQVIAGGGTSPYAYVWSNDSITSSVSGLTAGIAGTPYFARVTDNNGCILTASISITEPTQIAANLTVLNNPSCNGASTGIIQVAASGGTAPYTYSWSNGNSTTSVSGLTAGVGGTAYTVTVTDNNGCNIMASVTVTEPALLTISFTVNSNITCDGASNGAVTAIPAGGTSPYTYNWLNNANGQTNATATGLVAGNYTVSVNDNNGCNTSASIAITQPIVSVQTQQQAVTCNQSNGTSMVTSVAGITAPYTYSWTTKPVQTGSEATGLSGGYYSVTITGINGCQVTTAIEVVPLPFTITQLPKQTSNISCNGRSTGVATVALSGGQQPYTYLWVNLSGNYTNTNQTATGMTGGTYTITVTDANSCQVTSSVSITQPPLLTATISINKNVSCFGNSNGSVQATAGGGISPYTYLWSNGAITPSLSGLTAGTGGTAYSVTITDNNACDTMAIITLTEPAQLTVSAAIISNVSCHGFSNGSIQVTVGGGATPYTYLWSNNAITSSQSGLTAGTAGTSYSLIVSDNNSCSATASITITEPASLTALTSVISNVSCFGGSNGSIKVTAGGGSQPYTYQWSSGAVTSSLTILTAGTGGTTYTVTVTDNHNCNVVAMVSITEPAQLTVSSTIISNVSCYGFSNGSIQVSDGGGTTPYSYQWSNGTKTSSLSGLTAGTGGTTYSVSVTDNNSCSVTAAVTITEPVQLTASSSVISEVTCFGYSNGSVQVTVGGGTTPYTYIWNNKAITATLSGLTAGTGGTTYSVTVTDNNGCISTATVTISEPPQLIATTSILSNVSCFSLNNSIVTVTATGGIAPYTYLWSNGAATPTVKGLTAGTGGTTYTVAVTDDNNCSVTASVSISEPTQLTAVPSVNNNVSCFGGSNGSIQVTSGAGTPPYTFLWSNGAITSVNTGLTAGTGGTTYSVTIMDINDCSATASVSITEPTAVTAMPSIISNVSCYGLSNGSIQLTAGGGTSPYTYQWSNGAITSSISGLTAGTGGTGYSVIITDNKSCSLTASISITEPSQLTVTPSLISNVICGGMSNGSVQVTSGGGTAPYSYLWSNGAVTSFQSGLTAGTSGTTYSVTVTDNNDCSSTATVSVLEPIPVTATISILSNVSCFGGSNGTLQVTAGGGISPYTYQWSTGVTNISISGLTAGIGGTTYSITLSDKNGCTATAIITISEPNIFGVSVIVNSNVTCSGGNNGSATAIPTGGTLPYTYNWSQNANGQTSANATGLTAGTYTVSVNDNRGCSVTAAITLTQPVVSVQTQQQNTTCNESIGTSTVISVTGLIAPYTYSWNSNPIQTGTEATGLSGGYYTLTVTGNNGCTQTVSITIMPFPFTITEPPVQTLLIGCNGGNNGAATVGVSGGQSPYTFVWNNGNNYFTTSQTATGMTVGNYTVIIADNNGCNTTASIDITAPASITATSLILNNVSCNGGSNGSVQVIISGGTSPFTYLWSNGAITSVNSGLTAGTGGTTYIVMITDKLSCSATASVSITEPVQLTVSAAVISNVSCFGGSNGSVKVTALGGTSPYSYSWNNGTSTSSASGLMAKTGGTTYSVTITDNLGCNATTSISITEPTQLMATSSVISNVSCNGGSNGSIQVAPGGGTSPYAYLWSTGAITSSITGLTAGTGGTTYSVIVTDANGCQISAFQSITESYLLYVTFLQNNVTCNQVANGNATAIATGGTAPYKYSWSNNLTTSAVNALSAGSYTCTVTDINGCIASGSTIITQPAVITITYTSKTAPSCYGGNNGSAAATISGGYAPYSYSWFNGATTVSVSNPSGSVLSAGNYTLFVTDALGCTVTSSVTITQPGQLTVTASITTYVSCFNENTGSVTCSVTGGVGAYTYSWSNGLSVISKTASAGSLTAGGYTISITDQNGCISTASVNVTQPSVLSSTTSVINNANCNGSSTGNALAIVSGGTATYTYSWSNGTTVVSTANPSGNVLSAGTYTVLITDSRGCTTTASIAITQPGEKLTVATLTFSNVSCYGGDNGNANATVVGGTVPYTYLWSNGSSVNPTGEVLTSGNYTITVKDVGGCSYSVSFSISQPPILNATTKIITNVNCNGGGNASDSAIVTGGVSPYAYYWSNGSTTNPTGPVLTAGNYDLTVIDANNCTTTAIISISQPQVLRVTAKTSANEICNGFSTGSVTCTVSGGTGIYTYSWSNGIAIIGITQTISSLSAGNYTITVTDQNSCAASSTTLISQPPAMLIPITVISNVSCFGGNNGQASAIISGGLSPFTYSWFNGSTVLSVSNPTGAILTSGTYTLYIIDANGCTGSATTAITQPQLLNVTPVITPITCNGASNAYITASVNGGTAPYTYKWSNNATTSSAGPLAVGSYSVSVTDANGCTVSASVLITTPTALSVTISLTDVLCYGGSTGTATAFVSGGTSPYTYSWANASYIVSTSNPTGPVLSAGIYTLTIADNRGCTFLIALYIQQPAAPLTATALVSANVQCNGENNGSATVIPAGGIGGYSYFWSPGGYTMESVTSLSAGSYVATVTDANGCMATSSVTITQPVAITYSLNVTNIICYGGSNGSASVTVSGGVPGYTYSWNSNPVQNSSMATGLKAGNYIVTVTDTKNCLVTASVNITQPALLSISMVLNNVSCNGGSTGSAIANINGGTQPYTFSWSIRPDNSDTIGELPAGIYTVMVNDANGCGPVTATVNISQPLQLTATPSVISNVNIFGGSNGSVEVSAGGGTTPYTYLWNTGAITSSLSGLTAGVGGTTYAVTITDNHGCSTTATVSINEPSPVIASISIIKGVSCTGNSNGSLQVSASGGNSPYTYLWSTGATPSSISGLTAGTGGTSYSVTVRDNHGYTATASISFSEPTVLTVSVIVSINACHNASNAALTALPSGGTYPYTYTWSHNTSGQTNAEATGLNANTYTVSINDNNGCNASATATITQPAAPTIQTQQINVFCNESNGSSTILAVTGLITPYTYIWSSKPVQSGSEATALSGGNYTLTVEGVGGCQISSPFSILPYLFTFTQPPVQTMNISCYGGSNGAATVGATGGSSPYGYKWANANNGYNNSNQTATGMTAGNYTVTITDAGNCSYTSSLIITQPAAVGASVSILSEESCNGKTNGSATATVTGGIIPYSYTWSNGAIIVSVSNPSGSVLSAGTYTLTVTDVNGCTGTTSFTQSQLPGLTVTPSIIANVSCYGGNNGNIGAIATNGTSPYTFLWSNGGTASSDGSLTVGSYSVTVQDVTGCMGSASVTITQPLPLSISSTTVPITCHGANNAYIGATVSGGTSPYRYSWSNGATTPAVGALAAGTYTLSVTDTNGCVATASFTISAPGILSATISKTAALCYGSSTGSATATASGGTAPYSYAWANANKILSQSNPSGNVFSAGTYTVTISDNRGCSYTVALNIVQPNAVGATATVTANEPCNGSTSGSVAVTPSGGTGTYTYSWSPGGYTKASVTGLSTGTYIATVKDANGCSATSSVTISQPASLISSFTITGILCNGGSTGSIAVNVSGGTSPYSYTWNTSPIQKTYLATGLKAGTYIVTVTDSKNCSATSSVTQTQPALLTSSIKISSIISCNGGSNGNATAVITGGTQPYSYSWSNASTVISTSNPTGAILTAGTYSLAVTDANGCSVSSSVSVTQPATLAFSVNILSNVNCNGGSNGNANVTVSGGTTPYTYTWINSSTTVATVNPAGAVLTSGSYTVTVQDINGCSSSAALSISQSPAISISLTVTNNEGCFGGTNGSASATVTGGLMPYSYSWSNGTTVNPTTTLTAGNFTLTVKDAYGCTITSSVSITQPPLLSVLVNVSANETCNGGSSGVATSTVSGGTGAYTYSWNNGSTVVSLTATAGSLTAGIYTLTVADQNSCTATAKVTISQPAFLSISPSIATTIGCNGASTGKINTTVTGGTSPYTYLWSNSATTSSISSLTAGAYSITITDANGCTNSSSVSLTQPPAIIISFPSVTGVLCSGTPTGTATASASGGTPPYTYKWSNATTKAEITGIGAGAYTVTVKDANACSASSSVSITVPAVLTGNVVTVTTSCFNGSNGTATISASGGTLPYTYLWSDNNSQKGVTATGLSAGSYTVTITDAHGCVASENRKVSQPSQVRDSISAQNCSGSSGTANIGVKGGTAPYSYSWSPGGYTKATVSGLTNGNYSITVTDNHDCPATATLSITCGAEEERDIQGGICCDPAAPEAQYAILNSQINIFPNPNRGTFTIEGLMPDMTIELYDALGQRLLIIQNKKSGTMQMNMSELSDGVYLLRFITGSGDCIMRRMIKQ